MQSHQKRPPATVSNVFAAALLINFLYHISIFSIMVLQYCFIPKTININPFDRNLPGLWRGAIGALVPVPQSRSQRGHPAITTLRMCTDPPFGRPDNWKSGNEYRQWSGQFALGRTFKSLMMSLYRNLFSISSRPAFSRYCSVFRSNLAP